MKSKFKASEYSKIFWLEAQKLSRNEQSRYHLYGIYNYNNKLDIDRLKQSLQVTVNTNYNLRSNFVESEGIVEQVVHDAVKVDLEVYKAKNEIDRNYILQRKIDEPFVIERSALFRFVLIQNEYDETYTLLLNFHHIVLDGTQFDNVMHCIEENYLKPRKITVTDKNEVGILKSYINFENKRIENSKIDYWVNKLKGYPLQVNPPYQNHILKKADLKQSANFYRLNNQTYRKLYHFSKNSNNSVFNILKIAWAALIAKYCNQDKIIISYPVGMRGKKFALIKGCFVNTIFYPYSNNETLNGLLSSEKNDKELISNRYLSTTFLCSKLKLDDELFKIGISQTNLGLNGPYLSGEAEYVINPRVGAAELLIKYEDDGERLNYLLLTLNKLFEDNFLSDVSSRFEFLLSNMLENPNTKIKYLSYLKPLERQKIIYDWNATDKEFPKDKTISELFEEQVKRTPHSIAIVHEENTLSYRELNAKANQLARYIRQHYYQQTGLQLQHDTLIAVCMERSVELIVAVLAILKAGGAYVPIDANYPKEHLTYILNDTHTKLILTQDKFFAALETQLSKQVNHPVLISYEDIVFNQNESQTNLSLYTTATDLAYVIYTSGTTGKPKGVMIEHQAVASLTIKSDFIAIKPEDTFLQLASVVFDAATFEIWCPLLHGARLVIPKPDLDLLADTDHFLTYLLQYQITTLWLTKTLFDSLYQLNKSLFNQLRYLLVGGEALTPSTINSLGAQKNKPRYILNGYGPTESTTFATTYTCDEFNYANVPIGKPFNNRKVYVLDKNLQPMPIGVVGELYIGGAGLARGYLNQPDLTAERFINNPFATETDKANGYTRLYKTGDLVRWLADGNLEYIGRNDFQVKLRGFRIELGEIENTLNRYPGIRQSVVTVNNRAETSYLVAYYVADQAYHTETLIAYLAEQLPDYMVPAVFIHLTALPLTVNGKLDRRALPEANFNSETTYVAPRDKTEADLCAVWQATLGLDRVGVRDDFFRIGGDSILSIQLCSRLRQLGYAITVKSVFTCRTIEHLAHHLLTITDVPDLVAEQGLLTGQFSLLPIQQWFFQRNLPNPQYFNQSFLINVPPLDIAHLERILPLLATHHDAMRLRYLHDKGNYQQCYHADIPLPPLKILNCSSLSQEEVRQTLTQWQSHFQIEHGPLWQIGYLYGYADGSARLYFALHHLIVDSVSWRILLDDIRTLYEGRSLAKKTSSYRQWVDAVAIYNEKHPGELDYWQTIAHHQATIRLPAINYVQCHKTTITLNKADTKALLQQANAAYHTEINDLLLTALAYALQAWHQQTISYITLEGHGRENIDESIDVSRTVGWFTTLYPVQLSLGADLAESIKNIKENLRTIPNKGIGYSAFKYAPKTTSLSSHKLPPISFNYLGQFDTTAAEWQLSPEESGNNVATENKDTHVLTITGSVIAEQLRFTIASYLSATETAQLAKTLQTTLEQVITHCLEKIAQQQFHFTPSDFSTVKLSQGLLDKLQKDYAITAIYAASSLQQGFIYHVLSQPQDDAYRVQLLRDYQNPLDLEKLKYAWALAIQRYPALRMCFNWEEELIQIIDKHGQLHWFEHDVSQEANLTAAIMAIQVFDRQQPFDLARPSLFRVHLIKHHQQFYTCLLSFHHSILDGWSMPVLFDTVHKNYLTILHGNVAVVDEEQAYLAAQTYCSNQLGEEEVYWQTKLQSITTVNDLSLLFTRKLDLQAVREIQQPQQQTLTLPESLYQALKTFVRAEGLTFNVLVQFGWHKLIQVYTSDVQTIGGTTVSGRTIPIQGVEKSVGLYINTLPLIVDWGQKTVKDVLQAIHSAITELNNNSHVSLAKLQQQSQRLFHSLFVYENYPVSNEALEEIRFEHRAGIEKLDYPLGIVVHEKEGLSITLKYPAEYLENQQARQLLAQFQLILEQIITGYHQPHQEISLLDASLYQKIIYEWNATDKAYKSDKTLAQLFEEQVKKAPDSMAVVYEEQTLSYGELNGKANQLARYIRKRYRQGNGAELPADTLIALCVERGIEMIIGILGILKAGAAYVPLDPNYPSERIQYILKDTQAPLIITQQHLIPMLVEYSTLQTNIIAFSDIDYLQEINNLPSHSQASHLAYAIYTSGTTGKPKGVLIEHSAVINTLSWMCRTYPLSPNDRILQRLSFSFDASIWEFFVPLFSGSTLIILGKELYKDLSYLLEVIEKHKITVTSFVPSQLEIFLTIATEQNYHKKLETLRTVFCGGESLSQALQRKFADSLKARLINAYGPTEASIFTTAFLSGNIDATVCIGKAIDNCKLYVLNNDLNPVPVGVVGELYIGGAGLARGYLNQPELTTERFIFNPFATATDKANGYTRLYKTGDLVRWLADGNLEYIGRNDFQVKLRGYRIELSEIENILCTFPGIRQSTVTINRRAENKYLVGYYVADEVYSKENLVSYLSQQLPDYMVPAVFVRLAALPLTVNGKIDRHALPAADFVSTSAYVAPKTLLETAVCNIWQETLGVEKVSMSDDFFHIGGNSILAIQVSHRMSKLLKKQVNVAELFRHKTISTIMNVLVNYSETIQIEKQTENKQLLSFAQERLWFIEQYEEGSNAYHIPIVLNLNTDIDVAAFKQSLQAIVTRHEVLRSIFIVDELGVNYQQPLSAPLSFKEERVLQSQLNDRLTVGINTLFDLRSDYPIRVELYQTENNNYALIVIHHIAFDGWSMPIFMQELTAFYQHFSAQDPLHLPELRIQYKDFSVWQRRYLSGEQLESQIRFWQEKLAGYETLALITDKPRPGKIDYAGNDHHFVLGEKLSQQLRALSKANHTTLYNVLLTGFYITLHHYTQQSDLIVGTPMANRHYQSTENLIGFFVNSLALRIQLNSEQTITGLFKQVHENLTEAQRHQDVPFEKLVERLTTERDLSRHPLFQVMFSVQGFSGNDTLFKSVALGSQYKIAKFDLSLSLDDEVDNLQGNINYATSLFKQATIESLTEHYLFVLQQMVTSPYATLKVLKCLSDIERQKIIYDWNATDKEFPKDKTISQLFEEQVKRTPHSIAIVHEENTLNYRELNAKSNQLARYIRQHYYQQTGLQLQPDTLIAVCMERSVELIVAVLAILKAGGAYVPIDANYPAERINYILVDAQAKITLTQKKLLNKLNISPACSLYIALDEADYAQNGRKNLTSYCETKNLVSVIYTSGTTGKPKGMMLTSSNISNLVFFSQQKYQLDHYDRIAQYCSLSFDVFLSDWVSTLLIGASLYIVPEAYRRDIQLLSLWLQTHKITFVDLPTAIFNLIPDESLKNMTCLRWLKAGGEKLERGAQIGWPFQLVNAYGPTETTVESTIAIIPPFTDNKIVIGSPIANTKVYILNDHLLPVPVGVVGELYIGGAGLARGYLNQPELTTERFIFNPFATETDKANGYTRLYKTGDLVRWLADGNLEYIGRNDFQVKLRGYRIELSEIENILCTFPGIRQSTVTINRRAENKYLVGYYVADEVYSKESLVSYLSQQLPDYMVPAVFVRLAALPLTVNGKIDRHALPAADFVSTSAYVAPKTLLETAVCNIWQETLGVEKVSMSDDFFHIGGNSILAIQVSHRMSKLLKKQVNVAELFRHKTISTIMNVLVNYSETIQIEKQTENKQLLSFAQERLWFIEQYEEGSNAYHIPIILNLNTDIDVAAFKQSLQAIVTRHEVLRSIFIVDELGVNYQQPLSAPLSFKEERVLQSQLNDRLTVGINTLFDLRSDYPIRVELYQTENNNYALIVIHHIAFDGWSMPIFMQELTAFYQHFSAQDPLHLPELRIQYKDFSVWQRRYLSGEQLESQIRFWQEKLAGYETLALITDKPRPGKIDYAGNDHHFVLGEKLSQQLRALSKANHTTLYNVLLTGFYITLHHYTQQSDLIVGTPMANRHYQSTENLIGFFVNSLALRIQLNSEQTITGLFKQVHENLTEAQRHQDVPFEKLVERLTTERDLSRHPLFQVMFSVQGFSGNDTLFKSVALGSQYKIAKFDLSLSLDDEVDNLQGNINYATGLFKQATIERLTEHYLFVLQQMVANPYATLKVLKCLSDIERQKIIYDWNATDKEFPKDKTISQLFEEQVKRTPHSIAIVHEENTLSYRELNAKSNQLARYIRQRYYKQTGLQLQPDTLIAVCMERSVELIVAVLAILKAGGAYVPIDANYPKEHLTYILNDTHTKLILTQGKFFAALETQLSKQVNHPVLISYEDIVFNKNEIQTNLSLYSTATDLAYVIYTSGTTGKPKGVMIEHQAVASLTIKSDFIAIKPEDTFLQLASVVFDAATFEIWCPLLHGARLVIPKPDLDLLADTEHFLTYLLQYQITTLWLTKTLFDSLYQLNKSLFNQLRYLLVGGEALTPTTINSLGAQKNKPRYILNGYGPTESTTFATTYTCDEFNYANVPIGKPFNNRKVYVLDKNLQPMPIGVVGELYIGGAGLARGYLNQPDLTAERFINNPFATETDKANGYTRLYKTGDLVRWLADGNLEYIGRNDFQVKLRGFRIELGEIENTLNRYPGIRQSVVTVNNRAEMSYLVAYYVADQAYHTEPLIAYLAEQLPDYMVPAVFIHLTALPLTVNGKLDRRALPEANFNSETTYVAPRDKTEADLCAVWQATLGLDRVGVRDDFFRIGGNSILAIQLLTRIKNELNINIKLSQLFYFSTIENIALNINTFKKNINLIVNLNDNKSQGKDLFMIHPGNAGCEVYRNMAKSLVNDYHCFGVDNYNLLHEIKVVELRKLAAIYLEQINKHHKKDQPYYLLGWSLGGHIALEIASILENEGVENISVYLLDTILPDSIITKEKELLITDAFLKKFEMDLRRKNYEMEYIKRVIAAYPAEISISTHNISSILMQTKVTLFKAKKEDSRFRDRAWKNLSKYLLNLTDNNVKNSCKNLTIIDVYFSHANIIEGISTNDQFLKFL